MAFKQSDKVTSKSITFIFLNEKFGHVEKQNYLVVWLTYNLPDTTINKIYNKF